MSLNLTKEDIKKLIINSFRSSFLNKDKKKKWIEKQLNIGGPKKPKQFLTFATRNMRHMKNLTCFKRETPLSAYHKKNKEHDK